MRQDQVPGGVSVHPLLASRTYCKMFYGNLPKFGNKAKVGNTVEFGIEVTI